MFRGRRPAAGLAAVLAVALAACGAAPRPHAAAVVSAPTATSTPLATPAPTPMPTDTPTATPVPPTPTPPPPTPAPRAAAPPPTAAPPAPAPPPNLCGAPANPWGYNFCGGGAITAPPAAFCSYFACIANFANGSGYVIQCKDGMFSKSGGRQGSCSYHGGNWRQLFSP